MKIALFAASLALVVAGQPVFAQETTRDKLYELGWDICAGAMEGQTAGLERDDYAEVVDSKNWERAEYCFCVAQEFQDLDADDLKIMTASNESGAGYRNFVASLNLEYCLPGQLADDGEEGLGIDLGVDTDAEIDWSFADLEEEELPNEGFEADEGDINMCNIALDDGLMMPGFDLQEILAGMENTGQTREDLCGCVGQWFAAEGDQLDVEIENSSNPTIVYNSTLAGAINVCRI